MKRELVDRGDSHRPRQTPAGKFGEASQTVGLNGERRGVQRMADMADRFRTALVLVQQASAGRKIEQRQANRGGRDSSREYLRPILSRNAHNEMLHQALGG